jgi:hypothetical protein
MQMDRSDAEAASSARAIEEVETFRSRRIITASGDLASPDFRDGKH